MQGAFAFGVREMFTIHYTKLFVGGTLEGLTYNDKLIYPIESQHRIEREFQIDIADKRVFKGFGSPYIITDYCIVEA